MKLNNLSSEAAELRSTIIASSMTSCYLIMDQVMAQGDITLHYEDFRRDWIDLFKQIHRSVSQMKVRTKPR